MLQEYFGGTEPALKFLNDTNRTLHACRRTLMWTYAFAHSLKPGHNQQEIFEQNQANLEGLVEGLSGYLENTELAEANPAKYREDALDKRTWCRRRSQQLCEHVAEGYASEETAEAWKWDFAYSELND